MKPKWGRAEGAGVSKRARRSATNWDGTGISKRADLSRTRGFVPIFCTNDLISWKSFGRKDRQGVRRSNGGFTKVKHMKSDIAFKGTIQKFPGPGGWVYVVIPKKYTKELKLRRRAWGMYPITAHVGETFWKTKLMTKKGGDFFVALKATVRNKEKIAVGDRMTVSFTLK